MTTIHKFIYRAPRLREPLKKCIAHMKKKKEGIVDEKKKNEQFLVDNPYEEPMPIRFAINKQTADINYLDNQIRRYEIWLEECLNRTWFTKFEVDELELQSIYQYKVTA